MASDKIGFQVNKQLRDGDDQDQNLGPWIMLLRAHTEQTLLISTGIYDQKLTKAIKLQNIVISCQNPPLLCVQVE